MVDDIQTEVEQSLVLSCLRLEHGADVQLQFFQNLLINISVGVDEIPKKLVILDGLQMLF